jgi:hypothetical protein
MSRQCPYCGTDVGSSLSSCPKCGLDMRAPLETRGEGSQSASAASSLGSSQWDKAVVEPTPPQADANRRARFDRTREFYEAVDDTPRPRPTTHDDRTVIERPHQGSPDDEATVIIHGGRRGATGPLAYLVERSGIRAGKVHLLGPATNIGRGSDNDIVLADDSVSRHHARIRFEKGKFVYWDLASANFSYLVKANGSRARILEPRRLADGDRIDLGDLRVVFLLIDPGEARDAS